MRALCCLNIAAPTAKTAKLLASLCSKLAAQSVTLMSHDVSIASINSMSTRATASTAHSAVDYDALMPALARARARVLRALLELSRAYDKWLDEKAEEADAVSKQLTAVSAMCASHSMHASVLLACIGHMDVLMQGVSGDCARLRVPVLSNIPVEFSRMTAIWRELPDATMSSLSGRGMGSFVKGAPGATRNVVLVYPRVSSGALAEYVKPDDVRLMLKDSSGALIAAQVTVDRVADGGFHLAYTVAADCVSKLRVCVTVCDVVIGPTFTVKSGYDAMKGGRLVASYSVGHMQGMSVNVDGNLLALSYVGPHQIYVYQLLPSFERVHVIGIGRRGSGPAEFNYPCGLCFAEGNTVVVCDRNNNRVQRLAVTTGEMLSTFPVQNPCSIAVFGDAVAVDTFYGSIEMHSLSTGELMRSFGPDQFGKRVTSLQFSPDGSRILVAEATRHTLLLFTTDGVLLNQIGADALSEGANLNAVAFGLDNNIIVADPTNSRIYVFSLSNGSLRRTLGSYGSAAGQFMFPKALAVSGSYLYVLDFDRVQVFE